MFCKKCGNEIFPGTKYCTVCGQKVDDDLNNGTNSYLIKEQNALGNKIFIFGIISLATALGSFLPFIGIIFGAIVANLSKQYEAKYGQLFGRFLLGKKFGKSGIILGIIFTVIFAIEIYLFLTGSLDNGYSSIINM